MHKDIIHAIYKKQSSVSKPGTNLKHHELVEWFIPLH